jgi:hypothetical protein
MAILYYNHLCLCFTFTFIVAAPDPMSHKHFHRHHRHHRHHRTLTTPIFRTFNAHLHNIKSTVMTASELSPTVRAYRSRFAYLNQAPLTPPPTPQKRIHMARPDKRISKPLKECARKGRRVQVRAQRSKGCTQRVADHESKHTNKSGHEIIDLTLATPPPMRSAAPSPFTPSPGHRQSADMQDINTPSGTGHAVKRPPPSPQPSPRPIKDTDKDTDTEESHERKLTHLMSLRHPASSPSPGSDFDIDTHSLTPAVEFLLGLCHEQTLVSASVQGIEARITRIETKDAADRDKLRALRELLLLSEKLCFGLLVAELVVRLHLGEEKGDWGEGLTEVREGVGKMVGLFDGEVERLGV